MPWNNVHHLRQVEPADCCFIGQRRRDDVHQAPGVALAGLFAVLGQNGEAIPGENAVTVALLLAVIHIAEEGICLRPNIEVDTSDILVLVELVGVLKVDLLLVAKSVVKVGWTKVPR